MLAVFVMAFALGGCAFDGASLDTVTEAYGTPNPTPDAFPVCYAGSCGNHKTISLTAEEWNKVASVFAGMPTDVRAERERIARGLQAMELAVGEHTGLWRDKPGTFPGFGRPKQMDCVDETANTNTYLQLFEAAGFLRHYQRGHRVSTSLMFSRNIWPHTVASVVDRDGGPEYIIDMWYGPHGDLPYIMTRAEWEKGLALRRDF
jgi:hypothetical protein